MDRELVMNPNQPVSLTLGDVARILGAVRTEERRDRGGMPLADSRDHSPPAIWKVVITGSLDGEYYPGRLEALTETNPATWEEVGDPNAECWVLPLADQTFEEDAELVAFVAGEFEGKAVLVGAAATGSGGGSDAMRSRQRARITAVDTAARTVDVQPLVWDNIGEDWDDSGSPIPDVFYGEVFGEEWTPQVNTHCEIWQEGLGAWFARPVGPADYDSPGWVSTYADAVTGGFPLVSQVMSGPKQFIAGGIDVVWGEFAPSSSLGGGSFSVGNTRAEPRITAFSSVVNIGYHAGDPGFNPIEVQIRAASTPAVPSGGLMTLRTYDSGSIRLYTGDVIESASGQGKNENNVILRSDGGAPGVQIMAHGQQGPTAPGILSASAQVFVTKDLSYSSSSVNLFAATSKSGSFSYSVNLYVESDNSGLQRVRTDRQMRADGGFAVGSDDGITATVFGLEVVGGIIVDDSKASVEVGSSTSTDLSDGIVIAASGTLDSGNLSGDVTTSGGLVATIPNDTVTYAKMQNVSAGDKLLGRVTGAGDVEEIACTAFARSILDDVDAAAVLATLGITAGAVPTGTIVPFAGFAVPAGWLLCDGSAVSRTTYSALFAALSFTISGTTGSGTPFVTVSAPDAAKVAITQSTQVGCSASNIADGTKVTSVGTTQLTLNATASSSATVTLTIRPYGPGDGSTTFNVPDLRRRVPVGSGGTGTTVLENRVGSDGGEETHTLTTTEMPSHTHSYTMVDANAQIPPAGAGAGPAYTGGFTTGSTGGGASHNNVQPSIALNYIIKT